MKRRCLNSGMSLVELAASMLVISVVIYVMSQFGSLYMKSSRRVAKLDELTDLRVLLRQNINCKKTLTFNGITPATTTANCLSTSLPGGQVAPWLDLMRCQNRKSGDCEDVVAYLGAPKAADGSIRWGEYSLKASCSEAEESLIVRASKVNGTADEQDQLVFGSPAQALPLCYLDYATPYAVTQLDGGVLHACAIAGGEAWCWGQGSAGIIGDGESATRLSPVRVANLGKGVTSLSAGNLNTCAVENGALSCWGSNSYGQLGYGVIDGSYVAKKPQAVPGMNSGVTQVSVGGDFICAIQNGGLKCWGNNTNGQLGDGSTTHRPSPVAVSGMNTGVTDVSLGASHACAVQSGRIKCWGLNDFGQLGDGSTTQRTIPVFVSGIASGATAVASSGSHTCGIRNNGALCWGGGQFYRLGNGGFADSSIPVSVTNASTGVTAIRTSGFWSCALVSGGMKCWGTGPFPSPGYLTTATNITGWTAGVSLLGVTRDAILGVRGGIPEAWGGGQMGVLGNGTVVDSPSPSVPIAFP